MEPAQEPYAVRVIPPGRRTSWRARYLSLGLGEWAAAAVLLLVGALAVGPRLPGDGPRLALWSALVPLIAILVQAGAYWLLARRWVGRRVMPEPLARAYRWLRMADVALLAVGLVGVVAWSRQRPVITALLAGVWLFAVVEYVNYFVVRLAYPLNRWFAEVARWRTPRLVKDMTGAGTRLRRHRPR
jgi:hypothetical protein